MKYTFVDVVKCNMCGSSTSTQLVLGKRLNQSQGKKPKKKTGVSTTVCKCSSCGLIYANPLPIPDNIQDHYGMPPESYWTEEYFTVNPNYFQGEIARLKQLISYKPGLKSLDIGAGLGKQMKVLESIGFDTYGFEPSEPFYERAISKMGISPQKLRLGMVEELDYPEEYFDFISFGVVLEHVYNPSASLEKALRWLKPNGIIHIEVPSSEWLTNKIINWYYRLSLSDYVGNISPMHEPYHLYEFSLRSFQKNSEINGYKIAHQEYYVCQTFLPKAFDRIIKPIMQKTNTGMQLCVWLKKVA